MLDPQTVETFAVQAIEQTDKDDVHEPRPRTDCICALFEGMPHMLPRVSIFARGGMKTCFRHDEHEREADQHHAERADLDGQSDVVCTDEHCPSHPEQRSE